MVTHLPYFEQLAQLEDGTPDWNSVSAGLVVLRLFDNWTRGGTSPDMMRAAALPVSSAVRAMPESDTAKPILRGIVDLLSRTTPPIGPDLSARLLAYGQSLEHAGRLSLAADVFETVVRHVPLDDDAQTIIDAHMRIGYSKRMLGDLQAADRAYSLAHEISVTVGDQERALIARIGRAKVIADRGNLPKAAKQLDQIIGQSRRESRSDVLVRALPEAAYVAHLREQFAEAIPLAFEAMTLCEDQADRDAILADLAASFAKLGAIDVAWDAHSIIAVTAADEHTRWQARINLLEIASWRGAETLFEQQRRELASKPLPPRLAAYFNYHLGAGYALFGRVERARQALADAISIASAHELHQVQIEAEQLSKQLDSAPVTKVPQIAYAEPPTEVQRIGQYIRELREAVGA